jgi:hypothetical protein
LPVALLPGAVDGDALDGVVLVGFDGVVVVVEGVVVVVDGVDDVEEDDDGVVLDALDVEPVFSAGVEFVVVEVVLVLVPLPGDGLAGPLDEVVLAAHPATNRARTMV